MPITTPETHPKLGDVVAADCLAPLEIYREVLDDDGKPTGFVRRDRWRTPNEIYRDIKTHMDVSICKCGQEIKSARWDAPCPQCGDRNKDCEQRVMLVDEYDSCCHFDYSADQPIADTAHDVVSIMIYAQPGTNEGWGVFVSVLIRPNIAFNSSKDRLVDIYRVKCWAGMKHCNMLVERLQKIMGVWPTWHMDFHDKKRFSVKS